MKTIGVIIARFQSPYLHEGHKQLIETVKKSHNKLVVVLGVSPVLGSRKNPLDFHTRERMIKKQYSDIVVLPQADHPLDATWSQNLDSMLLQSFPGASFILYGSRDSFIPYYSGRFEVMELPNLSNQRATLIREQISDRVLDAEEFRTGVIYAYSNMYSKVYPTVDVAVFRNNKQEILLGMKDIDKKWRLLGGFSDPTDESFEEAAARELREECGPIETTALSYEKSLRVDDWRYKHEVDKIITTLFSCDYMSGEPKGSDDIATVDWISIKEIPNLIASHQLASEHIPQLTHLYTKYFTGQL